MNKESSVSSVTKSFNARISHLSSQGAYNEVLLTYASMLENHVPSDAYPFPSLLKVFTFLNLSSLGCSLHQRIVVHGLSSDAYIASSLINFYVKFGSADTARKVFDFMPERNVVPWTTVIGCYSREDNLEMAYSLFNDMRQQGIQPSLVTLLSILSGVSDLAHLWCWHGCATLYGFMSDITLSNSFLNVYGRCGSTEDSRKIFEYMGEKDLVSWNSLISMYAQIGNLCEVLQLLKTMSAIGMKPDQQTFRFVLSVAASTGRNIDIAFRIFERSCDKDVVLWTAMISGLVQNESADKALAIFRQMLNFRVKPSTATIPSVVTACAQLGSFDLGISIHGYVLI